MIQAVISTVGTSLIGNLKNNKDHRDLLELLNCGDYAILGKELRKISPSDRVCGAEINSLHQLLKREVFAQVGRLDFCVSDTPEGVGLGDVLKSYYGDNFRVVVHQIEDLSGVNPERFRIYGLRNLARTLGRLVRDAGSPSYAALNCTGGYKAQVAIATLIGQALGSEVFYKHEQFTSIIAFPAMPISFDYSIFGRHADILLPLERGEQLEAAEADVPVELRPLLEELEIDGQFLWALAPIGQIYLEGYRRTYPWEKNLPPDASADSRKSPTFGDDHHYPSSFKSYIERVWRQTPYITTAHSLSYSGQSGIQKRGFKVVPGHEYIVADYKKADFGSRMALYTTAENEGHRLAAVEDLNSRFAD